MKKQKRKLCKCGCGQEVRRNSLNYVNYHHNKTQEAKDISIKNLGVHAQKGFKQSQDLIQKRRAPLIGIPRTESVKQKISIKKKGVKQSETHRQNNIESHLGKHYSSRTEFKKGRLAWNKGKPAPWAKETRLYQVFPQKDTSIELKLQKALDAEGITYKKHHPILGQPDIFIEPHDKYYKGIAIFADGCYWHGCSIHRNTKKGFENREKDTKITNQLFSQGYYVARIWEHDINSDMKAVVGNIKEIIHR
ncbi:MAG: hypothetical protein KGH62_02105 [Candidatus Micrarchaeota archaeon]|nr:hypothetical protein [Candidatus Micrarchaeota archaeon]